MNLWTENKLQVESKKGFAVNECYMKVLSFLRPFSAPPTDKSNIFMN